MSFRFCPDPKEISGCGLTEFMNRDGSRVNGAYPLSGARDPDYVSAMSYGSINLNVCRGLTMAVRWAIDLMVGYMPNSIP